MVIEQAAGMVQQAMAWKSKLKGISMIALGIIFIIFSFFMLAQSIVMFLILLAIGLLLLILGFLGIRGWIFLGDRQDPRVIRNIVYSMGQR